MRAIQVERAVRRTLSPRRIARTLSVTLLLGFLQVVSGNLTSASAAGTPTVTVPASGWVIAQSATTTISGSSVGGLGASDVYLVTISISGSYSGNLKLPTTTGLTASYGYSSSTFTSFTKISFTGTGSNVNTALAALQFVAGVAPVSGTTPTISISVVENVEGVAFNPANNHYYKAYQYGTTGVVVGTNITDKKQSTAITWSGTKSFAGLTGYLVTITSSDENSFVSATIPSAQNVWIGAKDNWTGSQSGTNYTFGEGYWGWVSPGSPEFGAGFSRDSVGVTVDGNGRYSSTTRTTTGSYTSTNVGVTTNGAGGASSNGYYNWCSGEPNNADGGNGGEHAAVTNWNAGTCWNDLHENNNSAVSGFVVEWGSNAADGGFSNAVTSTAKLYVAPTISRVSGNNQIAQTSSGLATPIKALLRDSMGTAIPGASISWSATSGTVSSPTTATDVSGNGTLAIWTMPASVGWDTLTASFSGAGNPSITFSAYATAFPSSNYETDSALSLNGTSQYLIASNSTVLPTAWNSPFTLEVWVHPTSLGANGTIFSQGTGSNRFYMKRSSGQLLWYRDGWNLAAEQNCGYFPSNDWTHIALSWDGATTARCYINGVLLLTSTASNLGTISIPAPAVIGQYSALVGDATTYFAGQIDELKIWDSARSVANIGIDLATHTDTATSGLLAYYDFNEGAGSRLYNLIRSTSSAAAPVDFAAVNTPTWDSTQIRAVSTTVPYTTFIFKRNFLITAGGWQVPSGIPSVSVLVVAGGGAGGSRVGGGGGAGGYVYRGVLQLTAGAREVITVGAGGAGLANYAGKNGGNSLFGTRLTAIGGGGGGASNGLGERTGRNGGSGGGSGDTGVSYGTSTQNSAGSTGLGNSGAAGQGAGDWSAGGGGGANAVGFTGTDATYPGFGGTGKLESITGSTICYSAGGGGGIYDVGTGTRSNGGSCVGASATGGSGSRGALVGYAAIANTGSGGGGAGYNDVATGGPIGTKDLAGGSGGSGVIVIRWITASKPIFTQPTIDTTTAGIVDTITVSANPIAPLLRSYQWQSSSDTGTTWANISLGTGSGITSQTYTTPILETSVSGLRYQYRVIVTDSDTAGLFITDTSTSVYIVVNPRITITGSYTTLKYGVSHTDTFTVGAATGTGTKTITFTNGNRTGITWNTSLANNAALTIASTLGPGTYYDTITATDTKGAATSLSINIVVNKADTITVSALTVSDTYTGSILLFSESYTITGLVNADTVTAISWSYSGTQNGLGSYGPIATKPVNAGSYTLTPVPTIRNSDSYTAVVINTAPVTINRATRTLSLSGVPGTLKFGSQFTAISTPSAGSGDGTLTFATSTADSCTVASATITATRSAGRCLFSATISAGANYETATNVSGSVSLAKADSITVTVNAITPVTYTGSSAVISPTVTITGLKNSNTAAANPVTYSYLATASGSSTCATGGTCAVGDTGPGGGKVFYVATTQQSWGRYLEAAPSNWSGTTDSASGNIAKWCVASPSVDGTNFGSLPDGIGQGYANTYNSSLNVCTGGAIYKAKSYRGAGFSNWYLPTGAELALMATSTNRALLSLVNDASLWGYWGSNETSDNTGNIGSLVTSSWGIGATIKGEAGKNMTRPIRAFSPVDPTVTTYTNPPVDADTYTARASALTLSTGSLSDYVGVTYVDNDLRINRAQQLPLVISQYAAIFGTPYRIMVYGGSGTGAITNTVTTGTAASCSLSGDTVTSTTVGTCSITATKALDKNFETATATAFIFFVIYQASQPAPAAGSGSGIALAGATSLTIDLTTPPVITSLSTYSAARNSTIEINGSGFTAGSLIVKFWRNQLGATPVSVTSSKITIVIPAGANTGKVYVGTINGESFSDQSLTITP